MQGWTINMNQEIEAVLNEIEQVIIGKRDVLEYILMAILADGHILIDDIPGVGKTTIAMAFAKVLGLTPKRIQFTPDTMPSDITGFSIYDKQKQGFRYIDGAVMSNLLLADEINRTSPRTQSALLQVMEEGTITIDNIVREIPRPFIVIATQNPNGFIGTQQLPESQIDRFLIRLMIGYPSVEEEIAILKGISSISLEQLHSILTKEDVITLQKQTDAIFIHDDILNYIAQLVKATRETSAVTLGISPRGTIALAKMAKARAMLLARTYVQPGDVLAVIKPVFAHRLHITGQARLQQQTADSILEDIIRKIPLPQITGSR